MVQKTSKLIFNNEGIVTARIAKAVVEISAFLEKYKDSKFIKTVFPHSPNTGWCGDRDIILIFRDDVYVNTRIKVARQIDDEVNRILEEARVDMIYHCIIRMAPIKRMYAAGYTHVALRHGVFILVGDRKGVHTADRELYQKMIIDGDEATRFILDSVNGGGGNV